MDPKEIKKSSGTEPGHQVTESVAAVNNSSVEQPPNPSSAGKESKYDAGRRRLQELEDAGLFRQLGLYDHWHKAPTIIPTESSEESAAAFTGGVDTSQA